MDFSFSPKAKITRFLPLILGFLLLYEDAIIETPHEFFCLWRLISRCGASKYYLFSVVTKPNLGPLACDSKASLQTPGCGERKWSIGCRVPSREFGTASAQNLFGGSDGKVAQTVKNLPAMQETRVRSLVWEDPLETRMATHSSILAWRIPWAKESGRL